MKLSKRELALVSAVVVAAGYGFYEFVLTPGPRRAVDQAAGVLGDLQAWVETTRTQVAGAPLAGWQTYVGQRAAEEWAADPFLLQKLPSEIAEEMAKEEEERRRAAVEQAAIRAAGDRPRVEHETDPLQESVHRLSYAGYVELAGQRVAVVSGVDYRVGDKLESCDLSLKAIEPESLILTSGEGQKAREFVIPRTE